MPNLTYRPSPNFTAKLFLADVSKDPKLTAQMHKRLNALLNAAKQAAPIDTPRPGRTNVGRLKRSFKKRIERQGFFLRGVVENTAPYARYVHDGSNPHDFGPSAAPKLKFYWEMPPHANSPYGFAKWVQRGMVHHPGTGPQSTTPFFAIAARKLGLRYVPKRS